VNDLVKRLSEGSHAVEVSLRPERTLKLFKEQLDRGHVLVKFTETRGGTELGVPLDKSRSDLTQANFETETGKVRVCGELTLDYVPVRVVADIELPAMKGQGHLELLGEQRAAECGTRAASSATTMSGRRFAPAARHLLPCVLSDWGLVSWRSCPHDSPSRTSHGHRP